MTNKLISITAQMLILAEQAKEITNQQTEDIDNYMIFSQIYKRLLSIEQSLAYKRFEQTEGISNQKTTSTQDQKESCA